jgi:hypothetical protein
MSELFKIILTSSLTIFGGILVFVIGQVVVKFIIEPLHEQAKLIGEIANSLIFFANVGAVSALISVYLEELQGISKQNDLDEPVRKLVTEIYQDLIKRESSRSEEATTILRQQASQLMGTTHAIPKYWLWASLGVVPKREDVIVASQELIGLSNEKHKSTARAREIAKRLRIRIVAERIGK